MYSGTTTDWKGTIMMPTTAMKKASRPGEVILCKSKPRQRRDHQAAHGGDRGDDGAVQQVAHEGFALEDFEVVGQVEPVVGGDLKRHALDLGGGFQRGDRHPEEGEKDRDGAAGYREGDEPAEVNLPDAEARAGRTVDPDGAMEFMSFPKPESISSQKTLSCFVALAPQLHF